MDLVLTYDTEINSNTIYKLNRLDAELVFLSPDDHHRHGSMHPGKPGEFLFTFVYFPFAE